MIDIQFNAPPSEFFRQKPNSEQIKVYFKEYSNIVITHLIGADKFSFIDVLLWKFPNRKNILICCKQIDDLYNYHFNIKYKNERTLLWNLLFTKVIEKKKPLSQYDFSIILDSFNKNTSHSLDNDLSKHILFLEYILSLDYELHDYTCLSILNVLFSYDKINYDILKNKKLHRYLKNNIHLFFHTVRQEYKLDILLYTIEQYPISKNILFVFNELSKCYFNIKYKNIISEKLYSIVLSKKLSGLHKIDYMTFLIESKGSNFSDKLFDYLLCKYKLEVCECFYLLNYDIKLNQKRKLIHYMVSNFELDKKSIRKLLNFPIQANLKKKLFDKMVNDKPSFLFLKEMYYNESNLFKTELEELIMNLYPKNMVKYLENSIFYESIYDYESDYEIELDIINSNRIYYLD